MVVRCAAPGQFEIFDGLQRATTLTILLCVIRDLTSSDGLRSRIASLIRDGSVNRLVFPGADHTLSSEIQAPGQAGQELPARGKREGAAHKAARARFFMAISRRGIRTACRALPNFLLSNTLPRRLGNGEPDARAPSFHYGQRSRRASKVGRHFQGPAAGSGGGRRGFGNGRAALERHSACPRRRHRRVHARLRLCEKVRAAGRGPSGKACRQHREELRPRPP